MKALKSFRSALLLLGAVVLLASCREEPWEHLDRIQAGDIPAEPTDFTLYPSTRIFYRVNYHPEVWRDLFRDRHGGSLEEFETARSAQEVRLLLSKRRRIGLPGDLDISAQQAVNDGRNILISLNIEPGGTKEIYVLTFTARQGARFFEMMLNPSEPSVIADSSGPMAEEMSSPVNVASSMTVDSAALTMQFLKQVYNQ